MLHKTSCSLRVASLSLPVQRVSSPLSTSSKYLALQPTFQRQTRCLSARLTCAKNAQIPTLRTCTSRVYDTFSSPRALAFRFNSTSTSPAAAADEPSALPISQTLTWDSYLSLRQKRRYYNIIASSLTAMGTFAGGASFLLAQDIEKVSSFMFGLDPFIAMGIVCFGFGAIGWLMGPFAGGLFFRTTHRRVAKSMEAVRQILLSPSLSIFWFLVCIGVTANLSTFRVSRKKGTSIIELKLTGAILLANQCRIPYQITMAKRYSPLRATGIG